MRLRWRYGLLVALLGVATAVLPAIASSETSPSVEAVNTPGNVYAEETHSWSPPQTTVMAGGVVAFSNHTEVKHGVHWINPPATPACDSGVPVGTTETASGTKWSGTCTFTQPGTYTYYCTVHGSAMSGTITVSPGGTTTTTPTTTTTTGTPTTTTTTTSPPSPESPLAGSESQAVKVAKSQHGGSVKGSINLSKVAAGDRLEVDLLTQGASLAKAKHSTRVRVGRYVRSSLSAGKLSFSVKLNAKARRAIKRHHRLALTVEIVLTPASGEALTITRSVTLHA